MTVLLFVLSIIILLIGNFFFLWGVAGLSALTDRDGFTGTRRESIIFCSFISIGLIICIAPIVAWWNWIF